MVQTLPPSNKDAPRTSRPKIQAAHTYFSFLFFSSAGVGIQLSVLEGLPDTYCGIVADESYCGDCGAHVYGAVYAYPSAVGDCRSPHENVMF